MAKKKKRNWLEERDQVTSRADRLLNQKGSYEERVKDLSAIRDESVQSMVADRARTSTGDISKVRQDSELNNRRFNDLHSSYYENKIGKAFNGTKIPQTALKDFKSAAAFLQSKGIKTDDLLSLDDFTKQRKSNVELKTLADRASGLDIKNTQDLVRKSYNDLDAIKDLANTRKDAEGLLKDIEKYKKNYGNTAEVRVLEERAKGITDYIKENAKGGSAISQAGYEEEIAPLSKSMYDTKTQTKADVKAQYKALSDANIEEKYGKPGNLGYDGVKNIKPKTPAEKEWKEEKQLQLDPIKKYEDNKKEIEKLENEDRKDQARTVLNRNPLGILIDNTVGGSRNSDKIYELQDQNKQILAQHAEDIIAKAKLTDSERNMLESGRSFDLNDNEFRWDVGKDAKNEATLNRKEMVDVLSKRGLTKEEANLLLDYEKELDKENERQSAMKAGELSRRTDSELGNLTEDIARTLGQPIISPLEKAMGVSGEYSHASQLGREQAKEKYYEDDTIEKGIYNFGETVGTIVGSSLLGGAAAVPFTTKAVEDSYYNALDKGATEQDAFNYATTNGIATGIIYGIGLKGVNKILSKATKGSVIEGLAKEIVEGKPTSSLGKAIVKSVGKNAVKEGGVFAGLTTTTQVADVLNQVVNLGKKSDFNQMVESYKQQGMSDDEAWQQTVLDISKQIGTGAVESFASGAIMGAGGALIGGIRQGKAYNEMRDRAETLKGEYEKYNTDTTSPYFENVNDVSELESQFKQRAKEIHPDVAEGNEEAFNQLVQDKERIEGILTGEKSKEARDAIDKWENFVNQARDILGLERVVTTKEREGFVNDYEEVKTKLLETRDQVEKSNAEDKDEVINTIDNEIERVDNAVEATADIVVPEENAVGTSKEGKPIYVDEVKGTDVSFVDSEGNEVKDFELDDTPQTELMEYGIDKDYGTETTKSLMKGFELASTDNVEAYADNYDAFYAAGKDSSIKSFKDALQKAPELSSAMEIIGTDAAGKAFSEGRKQVSALTQKGLTKIPKGTFTNDTGKNNAATEYAQMFAIFSGGDVIATETPEKYINAKVEPGSIRGVYIEPEGKIIVDTKYTAFIRALNHEMKHLTDSFAIDEAKIVSDACMNFARNELGIKGVDDAIKNLQDTYKANGQEISYSEAQSEFINNIVGTAMASEEGIEGLLNEFAKDEKISDAKKQSIVEKFLDWIKGLITRLKELAKAGGKYEDTDFVAENKEQRQEIINKQIDALKATREILEGLDRELSGESETSEKFSLTNEQKELSKEYDQAVKDNDTEKAAELVEKYAKTKGYDTKVYHGTDSFGFTKLDTEHSDDKTSFFATDSIDLAETYSGRPGETTIKELADEKEKNNVALKNLTAKDVLKAVKNNDYEYELYEKGDVAKRNDFVKEIVGGYLSDDKYEDLMWYLGSDYVSKLEDLVKGKNNTKELLDIWRTKKLGNNYRYNNELRELHNAIVLADRVDEDVFYDNYYAWIYEVEEVWNRINKGISNNQGNYTFYANTNNMPVVDAKGSSWADIKITRNEGTDEEYDDVYNTRTLAKEYKDNGYDGVIVKDVYDIGGYSDFVNTKPGNVYIFFNPIEQVKSADPITYDDNGNVIPLEERFSKDHDDIRYSMDENKGALVEDVDSEGNKLSAQQQEYFKDSKVRDEEGNLLVMYHGTDEYDNFTVFKPGKTGYLGKGIYFTEDENYAKRYAEKNGYDGRIYTAYVDIKNPLVVTNQTPAIDILGENVANRRAAKQSMEVYWITPADIKKLQNKGYDGIIWKYGKMPVEVSVWNSNQIKNIDNTTPTSNEDIRYSIDKKEDDEIEVDARERELKDANNVLANTMQELYDRKLNNESASKIARDMKKNFNIDLANSTIKEQLAKVTDAIEKSKGNIKTSEVQKAAEDFIKNMMRYSKGEIDDYNQEILDNIKKTPILLSDELKSEIQDYGYWFRANRGKIMFRNNGIPLDRQWVEWADQYPAIFDATISDKDQPYELEKIINTLSEGIPFDDRPEAMEAYKTDLLLKIAKQLDINNRNITKAYNRVARLINNDYKKRVREALKEQREYFNAEIAQMKLNERLRSKEQRIRKETTKARQDNVKLASKIKRSLLKPTIKNRVPSVLQEPLLDFIKVIDAGEQRRIDYYNKKLEKLQDQLKYATGSQYDEILRQIEDIKIKKGEVDMDSAFIALTKAYKKSAEELDANGELSQPLLDSLEEIIGKRGFSDTAVKAMNEAAENFGGRTIYDLYLPEQKELNRVLRMIQTEINNYNKIIDNSIIGKDGRALHISDIVKEGANEIRLRDSELIGSDNKAKRTVGKFINKKRDFSTKNLRPDVVFKKLFGYHKDNLGGKIYNMLEQGYIDQENAKMKAINELQTMFDSKEDRKHAADIQKYDKKHLYDIEIPNSKGKTVKLPKSMIIQIKLHLNNERNRAHLIGGGLTVPNLDEYFKTGYGLDTQQQIIKGTDAKVNAINKKIRTELNSETPDFEKIKSWDMDIEQILSEGEAFATKLEKNIDKHLNDWDKKYIETHYKIFDEILKDELNRVTQLRFGVDLAQEDKYTRLISDKAYLKATNDGDVGIETNQEQAGFMKQRTGARNPIILESCLNADISQIDKSARYVGFMIPQHNLNRILKFTTDTEDGEKINLTKTIQQNYPTALDYIDDLKLSVFGGKPRAQHGTAMSTIMSLRAIEGLVANVNVELLQAASYPLAASEIRYSSLLKALAKGGKKGRPISRADRELIDSKTPLLWSRAADSMTEVEAAMNNKSIVGRAYSKLANNKYGAYLVGRIPKIDNATVGRLWYAAEYDVKQDIKDYNLDIKVGSEKYYDEVAKKFNKLTATTQPMYDPLHRNEYQRSNNPIWKMVEMFKTVLVQAYNTVYDKQSTYKQYYEDYKNGEYGTTKEDVKNARKERNRAITSWILSMSMVAAIRAVIYGTLYHQAQDSIRDENGDLDAGRIAKYYADSLVNSFAGAFLLGSDLMEAFETATDKIAGYDNKYHNEFSIAAVDMVNDAFDIIKNSPDLLDEKKRDRYLKKTFNTLIRTTGMPYKNTKRLVDGIFGMVEDIQDNGEFDYSNELEDSQKIRKWAKGDLNLDEVKDYFTSKQKVSNAVKKVYLDKDISHEEAVNKLVESGLYEGTKNHSLQSIMEGKVEKWDIDSYKDEYLSTIKIKNGKVLENKDSAKVISKIAKLPRQHFKPSYSKLLDYIRKWAKVEQ